MERKMGGWPTFGFYEFTCIEGYPSFTGFAKLGTTDLDLADPIRLLTAKLKGSALDQL
jgi:hypothetical protein